MIRSPGTGVTSYYLADGLGSTTQLSDSAGAITDSYSDDVFGAPRWLGEFVGSR